MLDINLFREEKGHNPELIRESQRRRFASVEVVDEIINLDKEWRKRTHLPSSILTFTISSLT
jgi:seryl-tRNA synthetase